MKKYGFIIWGTLCVIFNSCIEPFNYETVQLKVHVAAVMDNQASPLGHIKVNLKHAQKPVGITLESDAQGNIEFTNLDPGFYTLNASSTLFVNSSDSLILNATKQVDLRISRNDTLSLIPASTSPLIIREFFYAGSQMPTKKRYIADQYIEIFNNSNSKQNIEGLLFAEHESYGNGINIWNDIKDSLVIKMLWEIPKNGKLRWLEPGQSFVMARDAIDHKTDINGNPNSPVNLSSADFEFYMDGTENQDLDSKAENLNEIYVAYRGTDVTFHVSNGGGIMLLKNPSIDLNTYILKHRIKKYSAAGSSFKYMLKIPNSWVLDAVDVLRDSNSELFKRFPDELDAGFTYNSSAGSGTCISRRMIYEKNGIKKFMDTNNSSIDFGINQIPNPFLNE